MRRMPRSALPASEPNDADLVRRIGLNDQSAFESLMRQHNGRLFRVARAILKDDTEAQGDKYRNPEPYVQRNQHLFESNFRLFDWPQPCVQKLRDWC